MVMQFGQFLDHDITLTPKDEETDCCASGVQGADCFTIQIPGNDRFYSWVNSSAHCINVLRLRPVCRESVRQQYNEVTSFIDASNVYGSDEEHSSILRTYFDGRLQRNSISNQLPTMEQLNIRPEIRRQRPQRHDDFMAGDMRVNEQPFLTTMHVLFLREHNRIAKLLKQYLPRSLHKDEILYQEARRIVSAEMQNIVYGEYLPTILGVDYMQKYKLVFEESS
jgi:peroxidase